MTDVAVPPPRFLADIYQAVSECNKCSLCQAVCPTYQVNPVEWETARGRVSLIRDAMEGRLELGDIADGPLSTCLTCNNCVAACPPRAAPATRRCQLPESGFMDMGAAARVAAAVGQV